MVFTQHDEAVVVGITIGRRIGKDQLIVISNQLKRDGQLGLINARNPIYCSHNRGLTASHRAAMKRGVLACCGHRQSVGSQLAPATGQDRSIVGSANRGRSPIRIVTSLLLSKIRF